MSLLIGVPREVFPGEKRVATVPEVVEKLIKQGFRVAVEAGAGDAAQISDDAYRAAGAEIVADRAQLWATSDIVFKVRAPDARGNRPAARRRCARQLHLARAESRSPAALAAQEGDGARDGQRAADLARAEAGRALVDGQHRRLSRGHRGGARVRPLLHRLDHRRGQGAAGEGLRHRRGRRRPRGDRHGVGPGRHRARERHAARRWPTRSSRSAASSCRVDYVEEGSGVGGYAKVMSEGFQKAQRDVFAKQAKDVDIIITTALIPGKPAPKLITEDMVKSMKQGSVIVDMAAEQGGNCELTVPGEIVVAPRRHDHRLQGPAEPAAEAGVDAVRDQPAPPDGGPDQDQEHRRRRDRRRHAGRGDARHDRDRPGRGHVAAAAAEAVGGAARRGGKAGRCDAAEAEGPRQSRAARWPGRRPRCCSASARCCSC